MTATVTTKIKAGTVCRSEEGRHVEIATAQDQMNAIMASLRRCNPTCAATRRHRTAPAPAGALAEIKFQAMYEQQQANWRRAQAPQISHA